MEAAGVLAWLLLVALTPLFVFETVVILTAPDPLDALRSDMRATWERLSEAFDDTDDAPLWAEVVGVIVPLGLLFRAASHVLVAGIMDIDGELADSDVAAGNAVAAIRDGEHRQADLNGRVLAFLVGCVLWWVYLPGSGPTLSMAGSSALSSLVTAWLGLNVCVLFADVVLFAATLNRSLTDTTTTTNATR